MKMSDAMSMTYVGKAPCGCIRFAVVDNPEHLKENAKEIARAMRAGLTINRMVTDDVREAKWGCPECSKRKVKA